MRARAVDPVLHRCIRNTAERNQTRIIRLPSVPLLNPTLILRRLCCLNRQSHSRDSETEVWYDCRVRDENNATVVDSKAGYRGTVWFTGWRGGGVCRKGVEGMRAKEKETDRKRERERENR